MCIVPVNVNCLLEIAEHVKEDGEKNRPTDIYKLAASLEPKLSKLRPNEVVALVELAVIAVGGAAVWIEPGDNQRRL